MSDKIVFPKFYPIWLSENYATFEPHLNLWIAQRPIFQKNVNLIPIFDKALRPGRRTRPLLLLEIQKRFNQFSKKDLIACVSIELVHRAAIILDDFLDADNVRRGLKTFHSEFGLEAAILFPHILIALAYEEYLKLNPSKDQTTNWLYTLQEIALAEYSDLVQLKKMTFEEQFNISVKRTQLFFQMISNYHWILTGQKDESLNHALGAFGKFFQISNDIFDTFYFSEDSRYNLNSKKRFTLSYPSIELLKQNKINRNEIFKIMSGKSLKKLQEKAWAYWKDEKSILDPEKEKVLQEISQLNLPTNIKELFNELIYLCSKKDYWLHTY